MANHICNVDCDRQVIEYVDPNGNERVRVAHIMYAAEPSSAAGRYQWELNRQILDRGRRAWRESGQGQSRACREWDEHRRVQYSYIGHLFMSGRRAERGWRDLHDFLENRLWESA